MQSSDNTVLITGGSSGIGLSLAKQFHGHNNRVIITGRDAGRLASAAHQLPGIHTFRSDLSNPANLDELYHYLQDTHPGLNILINNAGVQYNYDLATADHSGEIVAETNINLLSPLLLTSRLLPQLIACPAAAVVFVSSALYIAPKRSAPVYCATKSAVHTFAKALRYQLEGTPVKVFDIIPPLVDTAMTAGRSSGKMHPDLLATTFFRRFLRDEEEQHIGKSNHLKWLSRLSPALAERIMKNG